MADPATVKRNMQRMLDQGATPQEIEEYARLEGVTPADVNPRSALQQVGDWFSEMDQELTNFQRGARQTVVGRQDPRFKDVPIFPAKPTGGTGTPVIKGVNDAALLTDNDEDYAAIIKGDLEKAGRLVGSQRDENGYEIITYRGDDGKEYVAYINKPGLDMADINRELVGAIPAAIAGFGLSALGTKLGLGALGRMTSVGAGEATTAGAQDVAASGRGAKFRPVDTTLKMLLAGGGGALFEGLSRPLTRAARSIFKNKAYVDPATGALTPAGEKAAVAAGLDPADMNARLSSALQATQSAANPQEAGIAIRTGEFGIPTTKGQRTKRPDLLTEDEQLRRGNFGTEAQNIMRGFDESQRTAIDKAVNESVGMSLAPRQGGREPQTLGTRIQEGAREAKGLWDKEEDRLWGLTGPLYPDLAYRQSTLYPILNRRLAARGMYPDAVATPQSHQMMKMLEDYANNRVTKPPYEALTQDSELSLDEMRRRLFGMMDSAEAGKPDKRVASEIYGAFGEWMDELARQGAMNGTPQEIAALRTAIGFSRDVKGLFSPKAGGKPTPAKARLETVMADPRNSSTTDVLNALVPQSAKAGTPKGTEQALRHMRGVLHVAGDLGEDTWNDVRLAYWTRLTQDKKGGTLSPRMLRDNIQAALNNQRGVVDILYSEEEQKMMRRLARALDDATYTPPNPSGTSYTLDAIKDKKRKRGTGTVEDMIRLQQRSATFQGDMMKRLIWRFLGKHAPNIGGASDFGAKKLATMNVDQTLTQRPGSRMIAPAGAIGAMELGELEFTDDRYPEEAR